MEHLELLDGVVIDLLKTKWDTFVKSRFYKQFYMFTFYFLFSLVSFISRPGPDEKDEDEEAEPERTTEKTNMSYVTHEFSTVTTIVVKQLPYSEFKRGRESLGELTLIDLLIF